MSDIQMRYQALLDLASKIQALKQQFDLMTQALDKDVSSLDGKWEGEASATFFESYHKLKSDLTRASELLAEYEEQLRTTVANQTAQEKSSSDLFKPIKSF